MPTPRESDFWERLRWSEGQVAQTAPLTIALMLGCDPGSVTYVTDREGQLAGVDYRVTLRRDAVVCIDHKARDEPGISRYWRNGPEMALEKWSVVPGSHSMGPEIHATGWTLDESKQTDYILFTYPPADCRRAFLVPFQLLRVVFSRNCTAWYATYRVATQRTHRDGMRWDSECVFVPWKVIEPALVAAMQRAAA